MEIEHSGTMGRNTAIPLSENDRERTEWFRAEAKSATPRDLTGYGGTGCRVARGHWQTEGKGQDESTVNARAKEALKRLVYAKFTFGAQIIFVRKSARSLCSSSISTIENECANIWFGLLYRLKTTKG